MTAVVVDRLSRRFGAVEAVRDLSFEVRTGELFGFLGPNGAGKTTSIQMLCTLLRPTSGRATVAGCDVVGDPDGVRRAIGLVFQETTLDDLLTAQENLRFHAVLYGVPPAVTASRTAELLDLVGLRSRADDRVGTFSGGMKRRLEIARGLLHGPRVLFLDEPTVGLDPQTRRLIWEHVDRLREREHTTMFLTTHYMDEAERCDRIAIVDQGQLVVVDTPANLKAKVASDTVTVTTSDDPAALAAAREHLGVDGEVTDDGVVLRVPDGEAFVPRLFAAVGGGITGIKVRRPSLDDVFIAYTGRDIRDQRADASQRLLMDATVRSLRASGTR